jgi:hypothetical protein
MKQTQTKKSLTPEIESQTETKISQPAKKTGRPNRTEPEPSKWTIRGVDTETRRFIDKAAERSGKTLGQFFNQEIREFCAGQIKKGNQPPASPDDIRKMVTDDLISFKTELIPS